MHYVCNTCFNVLIYRYWLKLFIPYCVSHFTVFIHCNFLLDANCELCWGVEYLCISMNVLEHRFLPVVCYHTYHISYIYLVQFVLDNLVSQATSWEVIEVQEDISLSKSVAVWILLNRIKAYIKQHMENIRVFIEEWRKNRFFLETLNIIVLYSCFIFLA